MSIYMKIVLVEPYLIWAAGVKFNKRKYGTLQNSLIADHTDLYSNRKISFNN